MHLLNVTDLSNYLFCPRKVYFRHVLRKMEPPNAGALKGGIYHKALELSLSGEVEALKKSANERDFILHFSEQLKNSIAQKETEIKQFGYTAEACAKELLPLAEAEAVRRFSELKKFISPDGKIFSEKIEPKLRLEFPIFSEQLGLRGKIDCMEMWVGRHIPIDFKTSELKYKVQEGDIVQMAAYIMLLEKTYRKVSIPYGILRYAKIKREEKIEASEDMRKKVLETREKILAMLESKKEPEKCGYSFCYVCTHF